MELSPAERNRHIHVIGKTRSGKSTFVTSLAIDDIHAGHGVSYLDPHGADVFNILDNIPPDRRNHVCWIDLSDPHHSVAFNLTARPQHLLSSFRAIWDDSWGPRLAWFLINGLCVLYHNPRSTLADLPALYYDAKHRSDMLVKVANPVVLKFWKEEFPSYPERYREEAKGPILNKIGQFLAVPEIHAGLTQRHPKLDLSHAITSRQIILLNLAKGTIGEDACNLYGALFLSAFKSAIMSGTIRPYNLFIDEFQSFGSAMFESYLSETAKFGLNITIAHQFLSQLRDEVRDGILGNVGTIVSFRIGHADAEHIARELNDDIQGPFNLNKLTNLPPFQAYIRRTGHNTALHDVTPISTPHRQHRETIIEQSNMRFARKQPLDLHPGRTLS
jgi:hypothetical protein